MKYFIDTEFLEGTQKEKFPISLFRKETPSTIDLISIGIVSEDEREYYAISKDFNLKEAWSRFDLKQHFGDKRNQGDGTYKEYWIRENVLRQIYYELCQLDKPNLVVEGYDFNFNYSNLKRLINKYGKTNKQIAEEIKDFCSKHLLDNSLKNNKGDVINQIEADATPKEFYAYYADYDWVAFCWLFGKMVDLPNGFPMHCTDLKQTFDEKEKNMKMLNKYGNGDILNKEGAKGVFDEDFFQKLKNHPNYPKQINEHNALADAKWGKKLYEFLKTL
jgi:hypothetical protein